MGNSREWIGRRGALLILMTVLLASCGGGGGGAASADPPPPPPPSPTLSLSQTSVVVSAMQGAAAPASADITLSIANAPAAPLQSSVSVSGTEIGAVNTMWQSASQGALTIVFVSPDQLGPGNYTEILTLNVCTDSACSHPIAGSPARITITYTVAGGTPTPVSFYFPQPQSSFSATTSDTSPESTSFTFYIQHVPPAGLYLLITQPKSGFVTGLTDTVEPDSLGELIVTLNLALQSPASLGSGFFQSSVSVAVCYDKACTRPVAGSPVSVPIQYAVYLTQGQEYSLLSSTAGGISDVAYDTTSGSLYVTGLGGYNSAFSSAVTEVNPATGSTVKQVSLNDGLSRLALSDDGQYLYAASTANPSIYRLLTPALTTDLTIDLGSTSGPEGVQAIIAGALAVAPAAPHTLGVALAHPAGSDISQGEAVFDDGVMRTQMLAPLGVYTEHDSIAWGATAGTLYVVRASVQQPVARELDALSVNASGITLAQSVNLIGTADSGAPFVYAAGSLYEATGFVRDAATLNILEEVALPPTPSDPNAYGILCLTPDIANHRLFILANDSRTSKLVLLIYALPSLSLQGAIDFGFDSFDGNIQTRLILWGTNGIAFNRNGLQILSGSFSAPGSGSTTTGARRTSAALHVLAGKRD